MLPSIRQARSTARSWSTRRTGSRRRARRDRRRQEIAERQPGARVVKAFNTVFSRQYDKLAEQSKAPACLICGDDEDAKRQVEELVRDVGYEPVDVGGLDVAPDVEGFARAVITLAYAQGRGPVFYDLRG